MMNSNVMSAGPNEVIFRRIGFCYSKRTQQQKLLTATSSKLYRGSMTVIERSLKEVVLVLPAKLDRLSGF